MPDDGLVFDPDSIGTELITEGADYVGVRIRFLGALDTARIHMQIDVGFGDVVYPPPVASDAFAQSFIDAKQLQWSAFRKRLSHDSVPSSFGPVVTSVREFLSPVVAALSSGKASPGNWTAPGPWT